MIRRDRMVLGLAALLSMAGVASAQSWSAGDASRMHTVGEYGVPGRVSVPKGYRVNPTVALPPNAYARRAAPGGLIETAARRLNPFSAPSRAGDITFAPAPYRQPPPASAYRVRRPSYGPVGYRNTVPHAGIGTVSPASGASRLVPGVNCPTCPR